MRGTLYLAPPVSKTRDPSSACGTFCSRRRRPFFFAHPRVCQRDPSPPPQRGRRCRRRMRGTLYLAPPRPKHATPHPPAAPSPSAERRRISTTTPFFFAHPRVCQRDPSPPPQRGRRCRRRMRGTLYLARPRPKQATPHPPAAPSPLSRRGEGSRRRRPFFSRTRECANETLRPRRSGGEGAEGG